jgi:gas vesicle protein GvpN
VETPFVRELADRTIEYLLKGLPVHFTGAAGCGKTALALYVGNRLGRPVVLLHGDDEMGTADLVGRESGLKRSFTRDQFIHTVVKIEEESKPLWVGRALTEACQQGHTVVYDEFTRSRPEANNVLLSVLEERVLPLRGEHIPVHADFRVIFTSNPSEYAGVHGAQDALLDRMVTIQLEGFDRETEIAITRARSGVGKAEAERVVDLVRAFRQEVLKTSLPSVRASVMIARILEIRGGRAHAGDAVLVQACRDVLFSETRRASPEPLPDAQLEQPLQRLVQKLCSTPLPQQAAVLKGTDVQPPFDPMMADILHDAEVEALLLRKLREKGLGARLLSQPVGDPQGETLPASNQ